MANVPLITLGSDYYILKFDNSKNMNSILCNGPWFLYGHYLSIQKWVPNFLLKKLFLPSELFRSAFLIFLLSTMMELYYRKSSTQLILSINSIDTLLKIDAYTSSTLRER